MSGIVQSRWASRRCSIHTGTRTFEWRMVCLQIGPDQLCPCWQFHDDMFHSVHPLLSELAIVMRDICTYYDAYSFEEKKLQRVISKLSRWSPTQNALEDTATPFGSPGCCERYHVARMNYFNMSFGELCDKFMSSASANDPDLLKIDNMIKVFWNWYPVQNIPPGQLF